MNDRISEFLKYLKIEKNYSSNTIKNYEIDIDEFKNYLNCEGIDYLSVDYDFIKGFLMYLYTVSFNFFKKSIASKFSLPPYLFGFQSPPS